jgi:hypothetical protein
MAGDTPSQPDARLSRRLRAGFGQLRLPRGPWAYVLAGAALLALSQLLWLWHSWPVREILDAEQPAAGATV